MFFDNKEITALALGYDLGPEADLFLGTSSRWRRSNTLIRKKPYPPRGQ